MDARRRINEGRIAKNITIIITTFFTLVHGMKINRRSAFAYIRDADMQISFIYK